MADSKISALPASTTPLAGTEVLPIVQGGTTKQVSIANLTAGRAISALSLTLTGSPLAATSGGTGSSSAFTANGVVYASSTSALATGTAIQFDGTNLYIGNNPITYGAGYTNFTASGSSGAAIFVTNTTNTAQGFFAANSTATQVGSATNIPTQIWVNNTNPWTFDTSYNLVPKNAAKGINFTANTALAGMTSQLLNWYEEGTWTVTWTSVTGTPSSTTGYYTRIGRVVTFSYYVGVATLTGVANVTAFTLPSTPARTSVGSIMSTSVTNGGSSLIYTDGKCYPAAFSSGNMIFSGTYSV